MNKSAIIAIVGAVVCALAIWESARIGFARTAARSALRTNDAAIANSAVRRLPNDAEAHAAIGIVLQRTESYADSCLELERAIQLRSGVGGQHAGGYSLETQGGNIVVSAADDRGVLYGVFALLRRLSLAEPLRESDWPRFPSVVRYGARIFPN